MRQGVLMYCFDTTQVCYHRVANASMALVTQHLDLPITVITNHATLAAWKNRPEANYVTVHNATNNTKLGLPWHNLERCEAFAHSPYDRTIVMDVDYLCFSSKLQRLCASHHDFLIHDRAHDVTHRQSLAYDKMSMLPLVWATVLIFSKTQQVRRIFDAVKLVKQHYQHYCNLYRIDYRYFRNDYAFAIALNQVNGYHGYDVIPDSIATLPHDCKILSRDVHGIDYQYLANVNSITGHDVHVLNKEFANV